MLLESLKNLLIKIQIFCDCWYYSNGVFYISGRDILSAVAGALMASILWMIIGGLLNGNENKTRKH